METKNSHLRRVGSDIIEDIYEDKEKGDEKRHSPWKKNFISKHFEITFCILQTSFASGNFDVSLVFMFQPNPSSLSRSTEAKRFE